MALVTHPKEKPATLRRPDHTSSDSNEDICISQKIQLKHGTELPETEFILMRKMIGSIFDHAGFTSDVSVSQEKTNVGATATLPNKIRVIIHQLSWEIICKSACRKSEEEATFSLLDWLRDYSWEAKVVLVLAAFAMTYGHFWTNAKPMDKNPLTQSVSWFLQPSCFLQTTDSLISRFKSLESLTRKISDVVDCMVELKKVTKENRTQFDVSTQNAIQSGVYWIFTSGYTCLSYNMNLVKIDTAYPPSDPESQVFEDYLHKLAKVHDSLTQSHKHEKEFSDLQIIFQETGQSIDKLISKFYYSTETQQRLLRKSQKSELSVLKDNTVAFFISHFDVKMEDYDYLVTAYGKLKEENSKFEVVWIPMVDQYVEWNTERQNIFEVADKEMLWYRLCDLSSLKWAFLQHIQQKWHFERDPILVTLGSNCQVININALPFVEFCGPDAFPFSSDNEGETLWKKYANPIWSILLKLDRNLEESVKGGKLVCFYGGHDFLWITDFLEQMSIINHETRNKFEMEIFYIGTDRPDAKLEKLIKKCSSTVPVKPDTVSATPTNTVSTTPTPDKTDTASMKPDTITSIELKTNSWNQYKIKQFWSDLRYLYNKRTNYSNVVPQDDPVLKDLVAISTYDSHEDGWAIMYGGSSENPISIYNGGQRLINCLTEFKSWNLDIKKAESFIDELKNRLGSHMEKHCTRMEVPATAINTYVTKNCLVCGRSMEKSFLFKCCKE